VTTMMFDVIGDVFWSRPGRVKATCKFKGLDKFPFDELQCLMEFGSWAHSGLYIRPTKLDGSGYSIGGSATAGQSFAEFELETVECEQVIYPPFIGAPEEDWPVLIYNLSFERAHEPYVRGYVLLQILLNMCGFACLWIPPHIGERMGLAITALLAAVASELTVSSRLPAAGEFTWFIVFSMCSMLFSVAVVFQSTAVIYFYYYTGSDLVPSYVKWMNQKWKSHKGKKEETEKPRSDDRGDDIDVDATDHIRNSSSKIMMPQAPTTGSFDGNGHVKFEADDRKQFDLSVKEDSHHPPRTPDGMGFSQSRLLDMNDSFKSTRSLGKRDADDFEDDVARQNNVRWQKVAVLIDEYSRPFVIVAYGIFLAIVFARKGNETNSE
jgi:Neurotransmitter-gated ion-channel transmembrane region/Neurotransmitter-gated ion-channel ligand binding domain